MIKLLAVILFVLSMSAYAQGQPGWTYNYWNNSQSGSFILYWPSNNSNSSNSAAAMAVGYIKWPGTATQTSGTRTINFGVGWNDNGWLKLNGTTVAAYNCCYTAYGSYTANIGDIVKVEMYMNNTGGGLFGFGVWWDPQMDGSYQNLDGSAVATTATYWPPALAGGASAAAFNPNPVNAAKLNTFVARPTADSKVNIEQIGNFNNVTVRQSGTKNNYVEYLASGSNNNSTIIQTGTAATTANWAGVGITGNNNSVALTQTSTGGSKSAFVSITENNNTLNLEQKDSGSHYAEINLRGGNKTVGITQQGSAGHRAKVELSGQPINLNLTQSGSTQQFYSITHTCATVGGCAAITVTQGQ